MSVAGLSFRDHLSCLEAAFQELEDKLAALQASSHDVECSHGSGSDGWSPEDTQPSTRLPSLEAPTRLPSLEASPSESLSIAPPKRIMSSGQLSLPSKNMSVCSVLSNNSLQSEEQLAPSDFALVAPSMSMQVEEPDQPLKLWSEWRDILEAGPTDKLCRRTTLIFIKQSMSSEPRSGDLMEVQGRLRCWRHLMLSPSSLRKISWDIISFFLMGYDVLMIPMAPFDIPQIAVMKTLNWCVTCFWTLDILLTFFVGVSNGGILEFRPWKVAKRYLKTWFLPDLLVVSIDWFVMLLGQETAEGSAIGIMRIGKSVRILRILRLFRLLRILKVLSTLEELSFFIRSESFHTSMSIFKMVVGVATLNHFIACGWYGVGILDLRNIGVEHTWVQALERNSGEPLTIGYRYTTSLHWSLTQFTPASMEVVPKNYIERIFSIAVILIALVMFSSFVSSITGAMTHLRGLQAAQRRQADNVMTYINNNKLSMELGNRVHAFVKQHQRMAKGRVHEGDIPAFRFLPEQLRFQMRCEMFTPTLMLHPLFREMALADNMAMARICCSTVAELAIRPGEELFPLGGQATKMFFMLSGTMEYVHHMSDGIHTTVHGGERICEVVLWSPWEHQGRMLATASTELLVLDSAKFRAVVKRRSHISQQMVSYAVEYVRRFVEYCGSSEYLTDIWDAPPLEEIVSHSADAAAERSRFGRQAQGLSRASMSPTTSTKDRDDEEKNKDAIAVSL